MDISNLKKEIKITFESLAGQVDTITNSNDRIPQIELDIAMGNIRKLYEDLYALNKQNETPPAVRMFEQEPKKEEIDEHFSKTEPVKQAEPKEDKQVAPEIKEVKTEQKQKPAEEKQEPAEKKPDHTEEKQEPVEAKQKAEEKQKPAEPEKEQTAQKPAPQKPKLPEDPKRTADLFSSSQSTLADKFMNGQDKSLGAKMQKNKINDLRSAIAINQKFIFLNELFDGDMQEYNKTIDQLNSFSTRDQAMAVVGALKNRHNWNEEKDAYQQFVNMIERRFGNE